MSDDVRFELLSVHLESDCFGRVAVPLDAGDDIPFELPEGALLTVALTFRLERAVDGLVFVDAREVGSCALPVTETPLGSFRAGGPYEVVLPAEKLPAGRLARGTYTVTGTFRDGHGNELARETHRFRLTRQERPLAHAC
ncbi:hypothetical protein [Streptomyces sp. NPDC090022]|uniref:hypothetical protein n=1 Tax=Streptomyces sp. NPDC090022 TaxID=3365920 RepID=UPI0038098E4C